MSDISTTGALTSDAYARIRPVMAVIRARKAEAVIAAVAEVIAEDGQDSPLAKLLRSEILIEGYGVETDPLEGGRILRSLAESGYAPAMYYLGWRYLYGKGLAENRAKGLSLLVQARAQGFRRAALSLGWCHLDGIGVPVDIAKALEFLEEALDHGEPGANAAIADVYHYDRYAEKVGGCNHTVARRYYEKDAAEQGGNGYPERVLGYMYAEGLGVAKDAAVAKDWYIRAIAKGDGGAACSLGYMYETGEFGAPNLAEAVKYYTLGTEYGDATSANNMGNLLSQGRGVPLNLEEAKRYYRIAADLGSADGKRNVRDLVRCGVLDALIAQTNGDGSALAFRRSGTVAGEKAWSRTQVHGDGYGVSSTTSEVSKIFIDMGHRTECVEWHGGSFDTLPGHEVTVVYVGKAGTTLGWPAVGVNYTTGRWCIRSSVAENWSIFTRGRIKRLMDQLKDAAFKTAD